MSRPYPIVEYAHMIGKSTADFTMGDFMKYMKWWMKQPQRKDLLVTPEQRKGYENDVKKAQKYFLKYPEKAKQIREELARIENKHKPKGVSNMIIKHKSKTQPVVEELNNTDVSEEEEVFFDEEGNPITGEGVEVSDEERNEVVYGSLREKGTVEEGEVEEETVANIELTRKDVDALIWGITQLFEDYDLTDHEMGPTLASLKEVLEGIE